MQHQWHLHRALAADPQQEVDRFAGGQQQLEARHVVLHRAPGEGEVISASCMAHQAIGTDHVQVQPIAQRIVLHQEAFLLARIMVRHPHVEPEGARLEAESRIALGQGLETTRRRQAPRTGHAQLAIRIVVEADVGRQPDAAGVRLQLHGHRGSHLMRGRL